MIVFRADGNQQIGTGHIMRCLSLADAFRKAGEECHFLLADDFMKSKVEDRGFRVHILDSQYDCPEQELVKITSVLDELIPELLIIDSYFVTEGYLEALKRTCRIAYLDDRATFAYPVDLLINYNAFAGKNDYREIYRRAGREYPEALLGIDYIPLREAFRQVPAHSQKEHCRDILISTGGADPVHLALKLVRFLQEQPCQTYVFHLLLGAMNQDLEEIISIAQRCPEIVIHRDVSDMRSLMLSCDMAVAAAGSTLYELCACGVPTITYALADNQLPGAEVFEELGLMVSLGDIRKSENAAGAICEQIERLDGQPKRRIEMAEKMQQLVDGQGAERIVEAYGRIRNLWRKTC